MMESSVIDLATLLAPIPGDNPAGVDVSYSTQYDEIKEARRADDANLEQGEWQTEIKIAQWPKVKELTSNILAKRSKDLQAACWLTEAIAHLHGFSGVRDGLELIDGLLVGFWESCYPTIEDGIDARAGKIVWLNAYLSTVMWDIPLTADAEGGYGWRRFQESRDTDNLGRQSAESRQLAISDGKISGEKFDKAMNATQLDFYIKLHDEITACKTVMERLFTTVDEKFGRDAPSLAQAAEIIENCYGFVTRIGKERGSFVSSESLISPTGGPGALSPLATADGLMLHTQPPLQAQLVGAVTDRENALRRLAEVAEYFKRTEPHSPVAYLIERAVAWGKMPLEKWLQDVIKDQATLDSLRETLGIQEKKSDSK